MSRWFAPRVLALHGLALILIPACVLMGLWQLGVYGSKHDGESTALRAAKPVPLLTVWGPDDPFRQDLANRRVRIEGQCPPSDEFKVRRPTGEAWRACPVRVRGTKSSILVVLGHDRGDVPDRRRLPPSFTAVLQPPEDTGDLSIARRVNESGGDLFSGYALLADPSYRSSLKPVTSPPPDVSWTVGLRNLVYALQWWVFGLFAGFMWWRMVSDALAIERDVDDRRVA
ncbi:MAG: SURF1 family protein [Aeromicrobium sp.]